MIILKYLLVLLIAVAGLFLIIRNKIVAKNMQEMYVRNKDSRLPGDNTDWSTPGKLVLFRMIFIFWGLCLIIAAYPIVFGPVQI
jgi:ABC-type Fe3+ transport system permease subunit